MKLYELSQNFNNIYELIENEEIPIEVIEQALSEIEGKIGDKLDNMAALIKIFEGKSQLFKQEEDRLKQRRRVYDNRVKSLKEYMLNQLDFMGIAKVEGKRFTVRKQRSPQSVDIDESQLEDKYLIPQPPKPDGKQIRQDLKEGKEIKGVKYKPVNYHIRIQ